MVVGGIQFPGVTGFMAIYLSKPVREEGKKDKQKTAIRRSSVQSSVVPALIVCHFAIYYSLAASTG